MYYESYCHIDYGSFVYCECKDSYACAPSLMKTRRCEISQHIFMLWIKHFDEGKSISYYNYMQILKKTIKIFVLSVVLLTLSIVYRFSQKKDGNSSSGIDKVAADVPTTGCSSGCSSSGCSSSSSGCSSGCSDS